VALRLIPQTGIDIYALVEDSGYPDFQIANYFGEAERDTSPTRGEVRKLIEVCPPHLAALVRFALATRKAGLRDVRFHDLRHTWASCHWQEPVATS